jgi:DNA topoisomerase-1
MTDGVTLIVTEKDNAARRLAEILSEGGAEAERHGGVNVYRWGSTRVVGLSGHVVAVDFPEEYGDWRAVEPVELADATVEKTPTKPDIVDTLQSLARGADRVTIATDYDREGELIGKEAYELVREVTDVPVDRVRFSSITDREVREAFAEPDEIDFELAAAGEARQIVDLMWGAALTRYLSLSAGRLGEDFVSVGRVQSPTLRLLVEREREIRAFEPEDYWELFAELLADGESFDAQYFVREDGSEVERIDEETAADGAHERLRAADRAVVDEVRRRSRTDEPPTPFNTTQFIKAAGSLGYGANRAMDVAESLYTDGYVTYPRTDNTVYPEDLEPAELVATVGDHRAFRDAVDTLPDELEPTRGDTETTDHPPIHPTGEVPDRGDLSEAEWELYELVVRRFLATVSTPAEWAHLRVTALADDEEDLRLKANGKRLVERGYHAVYPYSSADEEHLPAIEEGDRLAVEQVRLEAKQTRPPRRYGQSRLIERMEQLGLGTKATRHGTIEKLYDRGYVEGDPPRPTQLAMAVVEAAEEYADRIVTEDMTAQLERDMAAIADGEATLEEVTEESREMLRAVFAQLEGSHDEVGEFLRESMKEDSTLGPCPECGDRLLVREARDGSQFVGCDGYPDCEFTLPLPDEGRATLLEERCEEHDTRLVRILDGQNTYVHGCPRCVEAEAGEGPLLGACPDCGATDGGDLAVKTLRNGSRLVGCTRYPDCEYSLPLPRRGSIEVTDARCSEHDLPELVVREDDEDGTGDTDTDAGDGDDDPWELGCPVCNFREYQARQARREGLTALDGVGERTVEKLQAAGVEGVEDLLEADPEELAERVDGVSADRLREWQAALAVPESEDDDPDGGTEGAEAGA